MKDINRIIFVSNSCTARAPMAAAIFGAADKRRNYACEARGLVVQFPEPMNQKTEAVLISNGLGVEDFSARQLGESDFDESTLVIAMSSAQANKILKDYENAGEDNTAVLNELVGEELEVMDPYGASIQSYGLCFEALKVSIDKLIKVLEGRNE